MDVANFKFHSDCDPIHSQTASKYELAAFCLYYSFFGIRIEKGMGLIIPGFIPGALGKITEYFPSIIKVGVTVGIRAIGSFVFTILIKADLPNETGKMRYIKNN